MPSLFARGQEMLMAKLAVAAAPVGAVTYHRASTGETCDLTGKVWVGRTPFRVDDRTKDRGQGRGRNTLGTVPEARDGKTRLIWSDRDYLLKAADLVIGGVAVTPEEGDWFTEAVADGTKRFKVLPYADEPCWRFSDPQRTELRVHTKASAPASE